MSETMSAAVRFEDQIGTVTPDTLTSPAPSVDAKASVPVTLSTPTKPSTRRAPLGTSDRARLRELVEQMRLSVVEATMVRDVPAKVELWASYRLARAEAMALLGSVPRHSEHRPGCGASDRLQPPDGCRASPCDGRAALGHVCDHLHRDVGLEHRWASVALRWLIVPSGASV